MIPCERETEILQAMASGHWRDSLRRHAEECESCRVMIRLVPSMKNLQKITEEKSFLPDYRWVLFQTRLQRERSMQNKFQRISSLTVGGTIAATILVLTGIFISQGYIPNSIIKHVTRTDISIIGIVTVLCLISEFQLNIFLEPKLQ